MTEHWGVHTSGGMDFEFLHIRIKRAMFAIRNRNCLEIYYPDVTWTIEVHAVGESAAGMACVLGYAIPNAANPQPDTWQFIELHTAREVDVCGFFSEAPRPDYQPNDPRFAEIIRQIEPSDING